MPSCARFGLDCLVAPACMQDVAAVNVGGDGGGQDAATIERDYSTGSDSCQPCLCNYPLGCLSMSPACCVEIH